jgi:hypothetical protein
MMTYFLESCKSVTFKKWLFVCLYRGQATGHGPGLTNERTLRV